MLLISFIAFKYRDSIFKVEKLKIINYLFLIVFISSVAQVPRGYSYESLIELKLQPYYLPIEYGATYLPSKYGWRVIPKLLQRILNVGMNRISQIVMFNVGMYQIVKLKIKM